MQTIDETKNDDKMKVIIKEKRTGYVFASLLLFIGLVILALAISGLKPSRESEPSRQSAIPSELSVKGMNVTNPVSIENSNTNFYTVVNNNTNLYTVVNNNTNLYTVVNNISITNMPYVPPFPSEEVKFIEKAQETNNALVALFAINHVNWVVTKIKTYNDPAVLEEEYKNICADALNLNAIKDSEIIYIISDIMDVITSMRIEERERDMLKAELDQGMSDALADSISGINVGGVTPVQMVFNIISSAAMAAVNYNRAKKKLQLAYGKQLWQLEKGRMIELNDLNKSLLQKYWTIVRRYNLPDEYRVSENEISLLIEHLKDSNPIRLHEFLVSMERKYCGLQNYWYYRGLAAYQSFEKEKAVPDAARYLEDAKFSMDAFQKAQREHAKMLRIDSISAKAAMLCLRLMDYEGVTDRARYDEQIEIIIRNSTIEEWTSFMYCALIYSERFQDLDAVERVLAPVINHLEFQRDSRLVKWCDLMEVDGKSADKKFVASGDALMECRAVLARTAKKKMEGDEEGLGKKLEKIFNMETASMREKLFCYGSMGYKQALEKFCPDIKKMRITRGNGVVKVWLPLSWVLSREGDIGLAVSNLSDVYLDEIALPSPQFKELKEDTDNRTIMDREDGVRCVVVPFKCDSDMSDTKVMLFSMRYDSGNKVSGDSSHMIMVEFKADVESYSNWKPIYSIFGPWKKASDPSSPSTWEGGKLRSNIAILDVQTNEWRTIE